VTRIGSYAFQNCSSLTEIIIEDDDTEIGDKTITIGDAAFISCGFSSITLPKNVESIGYAALSTRYCSVFDFSRCDANTPPTLGGEVFGTQHPAEWKIIIPYGSFTTWSNPSNTNWVNYKTYMRYPDGSNPNETN
jgi:hypothetical protein